MNYKRSNNTNGAANESHARDEDSACRPGEAHIPDSVAGGTTQGQFDEHTRIYATAEDASPPALSSNSHISGLTPESQAETSSPTPTPGTTPDTPPPPSPTDDLTQATTTRTSRYKPTKRTPMARVPRKIAEKHPHALFFLQLRDEKTSNHIFIPLDAHLKAEYRLENKLDALARARDEHDLHECFMTITIKSSKLKDKDIDKAFTTFCRNMVRAFRRAGVKMCYVWVRAIQEHRKSTWHKLVKMRKVSPAEATTALVCARHYHILIAAPIGSLPNHSKPEGKKSYKLDIDGTVLTEARLNQLWPLGDIVVKGVGVGYTTSGERVEPGITRRTYMLKDLRRAAKHRPRNSKIRRSGGSNFRHEAYPARLRAAIAVELTRCTVTGDYSVARDRRSRKIVIKQQVDGNWQVVSEIPVGLKYVGIATR